MKNIDYVIKGPKWTCMLEIILGSTDLLNLLGLWSGWLMYVNPWCLSSPFIASKTCHHCIKDVPEEQDEWVLRMRMTGIWYVFILCFDSGQTSIDLSDKTQTICQDWIYLRRYTWPVNPLHCWLWGCATALPPPPSTVCVDFYEKLKEPVILSHASQQDLILVRKKSPSNSDGLSESTLKSYVQEQGFWCGTTAAFCI